jgi:hypothetical protein
MPARAFLKAQKKGLERVGSSVVYTSVHLP